MERENVMRLCVPAVEWQKITGRVKEGMVLVRVSEEIVKEVNRVSDGNVFFGTNAGYLSVRMVSCIFIDASDRLEDALKRAAMSRLVERKIEGDVVDVGELTLSDVDLSEFTREIEKAKERKRYADMIRQIAKEKGFDAMLLKSYALVDVIYGSKVVCEIRISYDEEGLEKLKSIDARDYYIRWLESIIEKLLQRNEVREIAEELIEEDALVREEIDLLRSFLGG